MSRLRRELIAACVAVAVGCWVYVMIRFVIPGWFWHPTAPAVCQVEFKGNPQAIRDCISYNFWSGVSGANLILPFSVFAAAFTWWVSHVCHVKRCPRLQWHPHPVHGHPVCKKHHPHRDFQQDDGTTLG